MEKTMNERIAYCGVDCFVCPDYQNGVCPSCRRTEWTADDICMPVKCCRGKSIRSCGDCADFPCGDMKEFYGESESHAEAYRRMLATGGDIK